MQLFGGLVDRTIFFPGNRRDEKDRRYRHRQTGEHQQAAGRMGPEGFERVSKHETPFFRERRSLIHNPKSKGQK